MQDMTERAIAYALAQHAGQVDKMGQPYILHPLRVMCRFWEAELRQIAVLHDVIEDTDATYEALRDLGLGVAVIRAITILTRVSSESRDDYQRRLLESGDSLAIRVKIGDVEDNLHPQRRGSWVNASLIDGYAAFRRQLYAALRNLV